MRRGAKAVAQGSDRVCDLIMSAGVSRRDTTKAQSFPSSPYPRRSVPSAAAGAAALGGSPRRLISDI